MSTCEITGDAVVQERDDELHWLQADPQIHVSAELLDQMDDRGVEFFGAKYEIGEPCPYQPGTLHARRRP